jgi:glycosyltransferase involved in cell wall biosynthesis
MKVLVLGWELPPANVGGLGTHLYELVKNLGKMSIGVKFLIPSRSQDVEHDLREVKIVKIGRASVQTYTGTYATDLCGSYGYSVFSEVDDCNAQMTSWALSEQFDVIHCHDWMTIPAGIELKKRTCRPLVTTIHSTEYDRTVGTSPSKTVIEIEERGIAESDSIITVSQRMKRQLIERYRTDEEKVGVIYNGVDCSKFSGITKKDQKNTILFLGRLTNQKGPSFFLRAAAKVLKREPKTLFLVAGQGEKLGDLVQETVDLGIKENVVFRGHLSQEELKQTFEEATVYVMPSVAEPFGITALESIASGTPVIVSKNAGVAEVIKNCIKVDYWDTEEIAKRIIHLLKNPDLAESMRRKAFDEIENLGWDKVAQRTMEVYSRLI